MNKVFDPITNFLNRCAWILWVILWISLSLGVGQEDRIFSQRNPSINYDTTMASLGASILLVGSVILQIVRQIYYSHSGPLLVRIGRWLILGATSIISFRFIYLIIEYGGVPSALATLIGISLLAIGLSLNSIGMMQQEYFQEKEEEKEEKWNNSWRIHNVAN